MSRIYVVTTRASGAKRFVRANTLNAAIRAHANETFQAVPMTTEQMYNELKGGQFEVLDAVEPEQT